MSERWNLPNEPQSHVATDRAEPSGSHPYQIAVPRSSPTLSPAPRWKVQKYTSDERPYKRGDRAGPKEEKMVSSQSLETPVGFDRKETPSGSPSGVVPVFLYIRAPRRIYAGKAEYKQFDSRMREDNLNGSIGTVPWVGLPQMDPRVGRAGVLGSGPGQWTSAVG